MKIALYLLIILHGIIHIFGFLKAFNIHEFDGLTQAISKPIGIVWLVSSLLFGVLIWMHQQENSYWWLIGIGAIILSQILIFIYWQDAKMGTLSNIVLLLVCVIGWSNFNFTKKINRERANLLLRKEADKDFNTLQIHDSLPSPVRKWLVNNRIFESKKISNVFLKQNLRMKLQPEQEEWSLAKAEQYFTINPPAFNWSVDLQMNPILAIQGRDRFEQGRGEMLMKIASTIPVVDIKDNLKINQAALQRYLAEIIWFPTAALSPYIKWESIDAYRAKAIMTYNGTSGSGVFHFNEKGDFIKFTAMRYKDADDAAKQYEWIAEVLENKAINEIKIPTKLKVTWKLENIDWTWLELEITEIKYNVPRENSNSSVKPYPSD
jgi:hypothetical protein